MSFTLQDIAWHRSVGQLVEALDAPDFWIRLVRLLEQYVPFDSWVALLFSQGRPQVFAECPGADGGPDPLFQDYLRGLYLLDPFYIASRENPCSGLFRLADVAPECFEQAYQANPEVRRIQRLDQLPDGAVPGDVLQGETHLLPLLG